MYLTGVAVHLYSKVSQVIPTSEAKIIIRQQFWILTQQQLGMQAFTIPSHKAWLDNFSLEHVYRAVPIASETI